MFVRNKAGNIVDVNERFEGSMFNKPDLEILSISDSLWERRPDLVEKLLKKFPNIMKDSHYLGFPKAEVRKEEEEISGDKVKIKIPKGKKHLVIYPNYLPKVGGIETAVYELAKGLDRKKFFVTIAYNSCESEEAMERYGEVSNLVKLGNKVIECDICLLASNHLKPPQIKAKKWFQWIHSDYERYNNLQLVDNGHIDGYIAVSKHVAKICKKMFDIEPEVICNLLDPDFGKDYEEPLKLVTNSRLSPEKGFYSNKGKSRVLKFAEKLKESGRPFRWLICGDNTHMKEEEQRIKESLKHIQEVSFVGYKSDILPTMIDADYLVQLSDFEGCPYAVLEALQLGIPCIVTRWNGAEELIQDGENGYLLRMDMKAIDIDKIFNEKPEFEPIFKSNTKQWEKLMLAK